MLFEKIVSEGIAANSYLIGSGGKAAVIDPRRDCGIYLEHADQNGLEITHIFETHRNEDFTIGSIELADRCGAGIYHGHAMSFAYGQPVKDGDRFTLGTLELRILETPGHTNESITLVLTDTDVSPEPYMVFCGDTIFAGDIARTDFYGKERNAEMAAAIYDSITTKILSLGDGVILCPAHGAGSICGEEIADHPFTTCGYEKRTNPLLALGRDAFIRQRTTEAPYVPPYFRQMETNNLNGTRLPRPAPRLQPLSIAELKKYILTGCQIVDIRAPTSFAAGHIPGSISIWRDGISAFIGWFVDYTHPIVIIDDFNVSLDPVLRQFVRLGYDTIAGCLAGGFPAWFRAAQEINTHKTLTVQELKIHVEHTTPYLLDVRDEKNWTRVGHIRGAHHIYVGELPAHLDEIPKNEPVVIYCDSGYKGSLAASILSRNQYRDITNVLGGMTAWKQAGFRIEK
ncbi:MAG: MBL fold metallo-hydrolase [Methanoregula sp.]|jgi:hydroxyacylglutathione hydrolase